MRLLLRRRPSVGPVIILLLAALLGGCSGSGPFGASPSPAVTPRPDQPCGGLDVQQAAGFYPALEVLLPATLDGTAPSVRDSGRYCSGLKLGTLYTRDGYREVHFAGAVWPGADQTAGISLVIYQAQGLTVDQVADSFAVAAGDASNVTRVATDSQTIFGRPGVRLDAINQETTQTVIVWPAAQAGTIDLVIGSNAKDAQLDAAVKALGGG